MEAPERVEGMTFQEWVSELEQLTDHDTAVEITRLKFGMGGDVVIVDDDGQEMVRAGGQSQP